MNEHESIQEKLALAAAGTLDPAEYREIQQHTNQCELCGEELERWSLFTQGLRKLPQPSVPAGLIERTQARLLQAHHVAAARRAQSWTLGGLAFFGWVA